MLHLSRHFIFIFRGYSIQWYYGKCFSTVFCNTEGTPWRKWIGMPQKSQARHSDDFKDIYSTCLRTLKRWWWCRQTSQEKIQLNSVSCWCTLVLWHAMFGCRCGYSPIHITEQYATFFFYCWKSWLSHAGTESHIWMTFTKFLYTCTCIAIF